MRSRRMSSSSRTPSQPPAIAPINWLNSAELTIEMDERSPVRLEPDVFDFEEEHGMPPDRSLLDNLAIENGQRID